MPLYGRRTLGRPQIDTTSAEAVTGLIGLAMQFVAQGASDKLRLKEKKEAQSLTLLSEQYREVSNDLTRIEGEYDTSKRLYEATLGNLSPIDRTGGSDSVADDLSSFYTNKIEEKRTLKGRIENRLNQQYSDLADIGRVHAGLATAVSPEAGDPEIYDPEDFTTKRLEEIFGVDAALIKKYRTKQPEQIPAVIRSLEKIRLEAEQEAAQEWHNNNRDSEIPKMVYDCFTEAWKDFLIKTREETFESIFDEMDITDIEYGDYIKLFVETRLETGDLSYYDK